MPALPNAEWVPGNSAGPYTSPVDKLLLHTTEGSSIEGAVAAYRANNSWPHVTADARWGRTYRVVHHLDFGVSARSLRNLAGGVQTNTDGVIQFEVVGQAVDPAAIDWRWLAENVFGPAAWMMDIPIQSSVTWVAYPASFGIAAPQRLSPAEWTAYQGFLGHQHCPENTHGDPGRVPILTIIAAANQEDDMTPQESAALFHVEALLAGTSGDRIGDLWNREGDTLTEARVAAAQLVTATDGRLGDIWLVLQEILAQTAPPA